MNEKKYVSDNPRLNAEWHPTKNLPLMPNNVTAGAHRKVWWLCKEGHDWLAPVKDRRKGSECPYCAGKKVWPGYNDLATVNPELADEWHPTKNGDLKPSMVTAFSHKKAWWRCKRGHDWQVTVGCRSNGCGCPYCAGKKTWPGYNDLATVNPELADEWHPTKNGDLKPSMVTASSNKKVWWICKKGHDWQATVFDRSDEKGCPYCAGKKAWPGYNDLATVNPELADEWHPTKNGDLKPSMVTTLSNKKVWWICKRGHDWQATINNRSFGSGCPKCNGKQNIYLGKYQYDGK